MIAIMPQFGLLAVEDKIRLKGENANNEVIFDLVRKGK